MYEIIIFKDVDGVVLMTMNKALKLQSICSFHQPK